MTSLDFLDYTKTWILTKYSKLNKNSTENETNWKTLDSSELGAPLVLSLTPTNFAVVKCENEIYEFINLWNSKDSFKGVYKGNSLMILHKMKDYLRKFRIQFLDCKDKSGQMHCEECIKELGHFFPIIPYEDSAKTNSSQATASYKQGKISKSMVISDTPTTSNSNTQILCESQLNDTPTLKDMTKILMDRNEHKLPLFYQQQSNADPTDEKEESTLKEFIVCCLMDPKFPKFVRNVESVLTNIVNNELNSI